MICVQNQVECLTSKEVTFPLVKQETSFFSTLEFFDSRVRSVADNFLGALIDFDFKVSRSGFVEVSLGVRTSFFPLVSVVGKGSALGRTMVGFIVVSVFIWLVNPL